MNRTVVADRAARKRRSFAGGTETEYRLLYSVSIVPGRHEPRLNTV